MPYNLSFISKNKLPKLIARLQKDYKWTNILKQTTLNEAYILPWNNNPKKIIGGGIISFQGEFQQSSAWHEGCPSGYTFDSQEVQYRNECVVYIGCLYHIWGHAITDNFKKIWYLYNIKQNLKLVYITVNNTPLPPYVYELFELAGIDLHKAEHITHITRFKEIINPDNSIININEERYFSNEFIQIINKINSKIPPRNVGKVYFTRTHLKQNRDIGEDKIEEVFRKKGYTIIAPEEYSIKEQLTILKNCTYFVATEGSISHSSIFCKPETVVILLRKINYVNPYSCFINQMRSLNVTYIDIHHSVLSPKEFPWRGPFYLYITYSLSRFIGRYGFHIPYFLHRSWYEYRYQLSERIKNGYYTLRAKIGIRSRLNKILK